MTTKRILLAGVLGGIAMFIWSFISHDVLQLGRVGMAELPNERAALAAVSAGAADKNGLYYFPGMGEKPTPEQMIEKLTTNPSGLLLYHSTGTRSFSFAKLLTVEFATEVLQAILVVFLLAQTRIASFGGRVGFIFVVGILAAITTHVPYWNWYGFPGTYTLSQMFMAIVSFLCVGLVAAFVLRKTPPKKA